HAACEPRRQAPAERSSHMRKAAITQRHVRLRQTAGQIMCERVRNLGAGGLRGEQHKRGESTFPSAPSGMKLSQKKNHESAGCWGRSRRILPVRTQEPRPRRRKTLKVPAKAPKLKATEP